MKNVLIKRDFSYSVLSYLLSLLHCCPSRVSKGVSTSLIWVFLLVFFFAPQIRAQTLVAPTGLTASADDGGIDLSWTAPSDTSQIIAYGVFRCTQTCADADVAWIASVPSAGDLGNVTTTTYTDATVEFDVSYRYAVLAYYTTNWDESSKSTSVTVTATNTPSFQLTATAGQGKVDLSWTQISTASGYDLYFCQDTSTTPCTVPTSGTTNYLGWQAGETTTTYTHTSLSASTTYRYQATHYVGGTIRSKIVAATTPDTPVLTASSISATTATLTLTNHSGNWHYKETAPTSGSCSAAQTSSSVNLTNLTVNTSYTYKAYSDNGCSTELASVTFVTLYDLNLRMTASNSSAITLSWTQPSGQTGGYDVYRCTVRSDCMTLPAPTGTAIYMSWVENPPSAGHTATKSGNTFTLVDTNATEKGGEATPIIRGETYYYAILGYSPTTAWSYATAQAGTALPAEPAKPVGLVVTSASAEAVSLRWKSSSGSGEGAEYAIYRCTVPEGESTCDPYDGLWLAYLDNTNTWTDTEVTPGETYRYQVATDNLHREENLSRAVTVTVRAQMPEMAPSPTGLTVTEATDSLVRLSWAAPEDDGKGPIQAIHIYRCNVDRSPDCSQFLHLASWNPALTEYTDANVESSTTYRYAVAAYRSADEVSPWSNQVTATTGGYATPTDFTVTGTYSDAISLSWAAPADGILGYNIYRCSVSGAGENCEPAWHAWVANPGDTPPAPTSYTDTGGETGSIVLGTTYRYQVAASLPPDYRAGDRSQAVTATAQGEPLPDEPEQPQPVLSPPAGLTVTAVSETSVSLSWTAPADGILGYNVYRCSVPGGERTCELQWHAWVANEGDAPPAPTSYTDTGGETGEVIEGAIYLYAVSASYPPNYTASELSETVITHELEPEIQFPAPTGLTVTATSAAAVGLSWAAPADGISGYNVYRCSVPGGERTCELQWHAWVANEGDAPPAPTSYTDTGGETGEVIEGATYLYAVSASYPPDYTASELSEAVAVVVRQGEFEASFEPGHQWFRRDVIPALSGNATWHSIAWKGERIQQHILVNNVPSGSRISLASSDLTAGANATIPAAAVSFRYPRFVAGHTEVRSCGTEYPLENTTSYLSDALFSEPDQTLPPLLWPELVWMSVDIPADAAAGEYAGTVTVSAVSGETSTAMITLQVSIEVVPWTMPDAAGRQFHLDVWQFPVSVLDRYNDANPSDRIEIWSEDHYALLEPTYRYLAGLGQRTVTTYIKEGALGAPSMVQWTLKSDGAWVYDYAVFDAYVNRLASWGIDQQISAFSPIGWNVGDIPYWDEASQSKKTFSADVGSSEWNTRWRHFLTDFRAHLLEQEWFDKTVIFIDERPEEEARAMTDMIRAVDENYKVGWAYTGYGADGPSAPVLSRFYDGSGDLRTVGAVYLDSGVITGETYRYAVDACNDECSAASSPVTMVAQTPAVPGEPLGLTATSATEITLNWTAPATTGSSPLTGYNIYRCTDESASCIPVWFDRAASGATSYTDSGVVANTTYRYTVTACNGSGCGNRPDEITVMTGDMVNQQPAGSDEMTEADQAQENQAVPGVPTDLAAFAASATAIQLNWKGNATNGYDLYRCLGSEACTPVAYLGWTYADNQAEHPDLIRTFYTSCAHPRPNSFVAAHADPADTAVLAWHALQRRLDGYLRWAFDNWRSSDPLDVREGAYTAGDFSLVYRSSNDRNMTVVPSIRSELLRDGIEDFEKVQVLRNSLSSCAEDELPGRWLSRLERTVDTFFSHPLMGGRAGDLISRAHDRLGEISVQLTPGVCP